MIRDSALFAGSDEHAESAGHILSFIASARLHDIEPEGYLRDPCCDVEVTPWSISKRSALVA